MSSACQPAVEVSNHREFSMGGMGKGGIKNQLLKQNAKLN
jgi:hypothetical protein